MKTLIAYCSFIFLMTLCIYSTTNAQTNFKDIDEQLKRAAEKDSIPGLAAVFVNSNSVVHRFNYGYADLALAKPFSNETIQPVGSVSKLILAVAVMKAVELSYFALDDEVNKILPFKIVNPYEPTHQITIRELCTHTSGIIDNPDIYPNTYKFNFKSQPYTQGLIEGLPPLKIGLKVNDSTLRDFCFNYLSADGKYYKPENFVFTPGNRTFVYSNIGSALLGYIIELKAGITYAAFTTKYILKPLKMSSSGWFLANVDVAHHSKLYLDKQSNFPLFDLLTYPDGGLKTTASDLSKFLIDVVKGLSGKSVVLKATSFKTMFTPQFSSTNPPARVSLTKRNKAILWNLYTNGTIGHDGDDPGVSAFLVFNPQNQSGAFFIANKYMDDKSGIADVLTAVIRHKP